MASILRNGNLVVLTSGYLGAAFEIGKEEVVDLIDHKRIHSQLGESSTSELSKNAKKLEYKEEEDNGHEVNQNESLENLESSLSRNVESMDSNEPASEAVNVDDVQFIVSVDISQCRQYIAMLSSEKHLLVWCTNNWELIISRLLIRKASRVRFTPSGKEILVADKSGSLYSFPLQDVSSNGKLILAHLSMLLDVIVTPDERFIITCDRDEKIRVSYFSTPYNIQSFCQGHLEFVSCISILPSNPSILVSGSGDGTIRFWNYYSGVEIESLHCHTIHGDGDCERNSLAVKSFSLQSLNEKTLLCVCLSEFLGSLVYEIETHNMQVDIKFIQKLSYKAEPFSLTLDSLSLIWSVIPVDGNTVEVVCHGIRTTVGDDVKLILKRINARKQFLSESLAVPSLVPQLFKKKFSNQGTDREITGEGSESPSKNGPPPKKAKQSCDKEETT